MAYSKIKGLIDGSLPASERVRSIVMRAGNERYKETVDAYPLGEKHFADIFFSVRPISGTTVSLWNLKELLTWNGFFTISEMEAIKDYIYKEKTHEFCVEYRF